MKARVAGMTAGVVLVCLCARGQDSKGPAGAWDAFTEAGKTAMESRQYAEAEKDFRDALSAAEKLGEKDARFAGALLYLAQACDAESKSDEAEVFARRAAEAMEKALKAVKPHTAGEQFIQANVACATFDNAADIFAAHQKYGDAEILYGRVIKIRSEMAVEKQTPRNNEDFFRFAFQFVEGAKTKLAVANEKLGNLYFAERKYQDAAAVYEEAVRARESEQATDQRVLAQTLTNLATCYAAQGKYDRAEPLYQRALAAFEHARWSERPETITTLQLYALMLKKAGRDEDAKAMLEKAAAIKTKLNEKEP